MSIIDEDMKWRDVTHEDSWDDYPEYWGEDDAWLEDEYEARYDPHDEDQWDYEDQDDEGWPYPDDDDEEAPF